MLIQVTLILCPILIREQKKPKRELCLDLTNAIYGKANKHGYWVMNWKMLAKRISVVR